MKIAAVQFTPTTDPAENLEQMRRRAAEAADKGAHVIVFPEQAMVLLQAVTIEGLSGIAAEWWGRFEALTAVLAATHNAVVVAPGFEPNPDGLPFNTTIVVAPDGTELARYRKLHLYVAFAASEAEHTAPGSELPPVFDVEAGGEKLTFGLANCYDVRFPELFRSMADRGANAMLLVAAWASGQGKEEHWTTLTQARAIENVCWFVACATVGGGSRNAATVGLSRVVDPLGTVVSALGPRDEGVLVAEIGPEAVDRARESLPAIVNRRIRLGYDFLP
ncbi:nitrilase-related carbon-nitrogen hydrolase [Leucobacter denitrificans]|uniref:Carbon-nitrogen hydrolase n=1 Tax=Leucobacter denitrificans TaxID=683042 RepID=A0A7G9S757_9MICO|nr:nitrilase-related carbon-nitrogen hydrolase [Leucobacter denitrificans]QNN63682.1 carbon-nitrogen hydrolase [Leucobacter denitrificans]